MERYKRLGLNIIWIFVGNFGAKAISFLLLPFYTHWLSPEDYGVTDVLNVYASLVSTIIFCNITDSIFIFPKGEKLERQKMYFSSCIVFFLIAVSFLTMLFFTIAFVFKHYEINSIFTDYIWYVWLMASTSMFSQIVQQFVRSIDKIKIYSATGIVSTICTALFSFLLIPLYGVDGFVISMSFAALVASVYTIFAAKAHRYIDMKLIDRRSISEMLKYSIPLIPNGLMWFLINSLNRPLLEHYTSLAAIGIYAVAYKIPSVLKMTFQMFQQAWVISALEEAKTESFDVFYNRMLKLLVIIQVSLAIILTISSKYFVELLTSEGYNDAYRYIPMLIISVIFDNIAAFVGVNFSISRQSKYYFYSTLYGGLSAVLFNSILIPLWGIWGACISVVLSLFCTMIARIIYSWRYVKITDLSFYVEILTIIFCLILAHSFRSRLLFGIFYLFLTCFIVIQYRNIVFIINLITSKYASYKNNKRNLSSR